MSRSRPSLAVALCALIVLWLPAAADARSKRAHGEASARIALKLKQADRALRAAVRGDEEAATRSLARVRSTLASARKATVRRVTVGDRRAPQAVRVLERAHHRVVVVSATLLDGAGDELTEAAGSTLLAAYDGRDAVVAAIGDRAGAPDGERYLPILAKSLRALASEEADLEDARADDELTAEGERAVDAAIERAGAGHDAAAAAVDAIEAGLAADEEEEEGEEEQCEEGCAGVDYGAAQERRTPAGAAPADEGTGHEEAEDDREEAEDDREEGEERSQGRRGRDRGRGRGRGRGRERD